MYKGWMYNVAAWFWVWSHLNSTSTVFEATSSYYSIMAFLQNFRDFQVFVFGYKPQNENPEITENLYFWVYNVQMHMNLFFDHCFKFLRAKTKINKNLLNLINVVGLETFKRQTPDWKYGWIIFSLMWFEASQLFLKLRSHNAVL